jgi:hypothetical protein
VRRIGRHILNTLAVISLLLCAATVALWLRSLTGYYGQALWSYDRWLPGGGAASDLVEFRSDRDLWVTLFSGRIGPPRPDLSGGYYINAQESGGHPRFAVRFFDADSLTPNRSGWPLRYSRSTQTATQGLDDARSVTVGASYWLVAGLLAICPVWVTGRVAVRERRRRLLRRAGRFRRCGYDLRATPDRCPECGADSGKSETISDKSCGSRIIGAVRRGH